MDFSPNSFLKIDQNDSNKPWKMKKLYIFAFFDIDYTEFEKKDHNKFRPKLSKILLFKVGQPSLFKLVLWE